MNEENEFPELSMLEEQDGRTRRSERVVRHILLNNIKQQDRIKILEKRMARLEKRTFELFCKELEAELEKK